MQRSSTTSTPRSRRRSSANTSSRSSMTFASTWRRSCSSSRIFSSIRTRERSTPTRGSLTPVFLGFGRQRERDRRRLLHFELGAAVGTRDDLALHRVGGDVHV